MSWLFKEKGHSELYLKYRPRYPDGVFKFIIEKLEKIYEQLPEQERTKYAKIGGKFKLAVDVGCGPGISTLALTDYFHETFGVDGSESQIFEAKKDYGNRDPSKVTFLCHDASDLSSLFDESSIDLITVATAIHWFNRPKFYAECKKILRPGGLLVAYSYGIQTYEDPRHQKIFDEFYFDNLREYIEDELHHVEDEYAELFDEFKTYFSSSERNDSFVLEMSPNLDHYVGHLSSWSPYRKYKALNPGKEDPLKILYEESLKIQPDPSQGVKQQKSIFIIYGSKDYQLSQS